MSGSTRVTVLVENTAVGRGARGEHGLSLWIEVGSRRVLFDTGQSFEILLHNAHRLDVDLATVDAVVLSHGHYDHAGGLEELLRRSEGLPLFLHPGALARRYSRQEDESVEEVGISPPVDREFLEAHSSSIAWTRGPTPVCESLVASGSVPRGTDFEDTGGDFFLDVTCETPDAIEDDQALFFDTEEGTVVLLGCGHSGVVNTLNHVRDLTGDRPIHGVIGGFHLLHASRDRLDRTVDALRELDVPLIAPGHCTGPRAQVRLGSEFQDRWQPCRVGDRFEFPSGGIWSG